MCRIKVGALVETCSLSVLALQVALDMADNTWSILDKPDGARFLKALLSMKADHGVAAGLKGTIVRRVSEQFEGCVVDAMVSQFSRRVPPTPPSAE